MVVRVVVRALAIALLVLGGLVASPTSFAQTQFKGDDFVRSEKKVDKIDFLYKASRWTLLAGTGVDGITTGIGLSKGYSEVGWAGRFGKHDTFTAVGGNALLNFGVGFASRRLHDRGGRWRIVAAGLDLLKGGDSAVAGFRNIRYCHRR